MVENAPKSLAAGASPRPAGRLTSLPRPFAVQGREGKGMGEGREGAGGEMRRRGGEGGEGKREGGAGREGKSGAGRGGGGEGEGVPTNSFFSK